MAKSDLTAKLKVLFANAVLDASPFGRSSEPSIWLEMKSIAKVSSHLKDEAGFDWLENLSVVDVDGAFLISYFLRSTATGQTLVLRGTLLPDSPDEVVETLSVQAIWPMAAPFESECAELFGIRFGGGAGPGHRILPDGWEGYPLRKNYVFPFEFGDIPHSRPVSGGQP